MIHRFWNRLGRQVTVPLGNHTILCRNVNLATIAQPPHSNFAFRDIQPGGIQSRFDVELRSQDFKQRGRRVDEHRLAFRLWDDIG